MTELTLCTRWFSADHPSLQRTGRMSVSGGDVRMYWPCSSVSFWTDAPCLTVKWTEHGAQNQLMMHTAHRPPRPCAPFMELPTPGVVTLTKRTEGNMGTVRMHGIAIPEGSSIRTPPAPSMRLEFYGDSITAGHGVHGPEDIPENHDPMSSFAAQATHMLGAAHHCIAQSGLGLLQSWQPETLFDLWDGCLGADQGWDFQRWRADVVVVNIGQNDHWLGTSPRLQPAYVRLVGMLRQHHPCAHIILALGCMSAAQPETAAHLATLGAVSALRTQGDSRVHSLVFAHTPGGHPGFLAHKTMAEALAQLIRTLD